DRARAPGARHLRASRRQHRPPQPDRAGVRDCVTQPWVVDPLRQGGEGFGGGGVGGGGSEPAGQEEQESEASRHEAVLSKEQIQGAIPNNSALPGKGISSGSE